MCNSGLKKAKEILSLQDVSERFIGSRALYIEPYNVHFPALDKERFL